MKYFVIFLLTLLFLTHPLFGQFERIQGEWSGNIPTANGHLFIALKLDKIQGEEMIGKLYDSSYDDGSFCLSEVVAKKITNKRFLIEGKKMIRSRNTAKNIHNLSIIYFDFSHPDTIMAQKVEEGNYSALVGKKKSISFKMSRKRMMQQESPDEETEEMDTFEEISSIETLPPHSASTDTAIAHTPENTLAHKTADEHHTYIKANYEALDGEKSVFYYTMFVNDYDQQDGDVVRIAVNGQVLSRILVVKVQAYTLPVELHKGDNIIEVTSLSEGNISPTTLQIKLLGAGSNAIIYEANISMHKDETVKKTITIQ